MPGNKIGGMKARDANYKRFGKDFYRKIGHLGGISPTNKPKGFAANRELAVVAGREGGRISRRTNVPNGQGKKRSKDGPDKRDS